MICSSWRLRRVQDVVVTAKLDDAVQTATTVTLEVKPEEDDR